MTTITTSLHIPHHGDPTEPMWGRYEATISVEATPPSGRAVTLTAEAGRGAHGALALGRLEAWHEMGRDVWRASDDRGHRIDQFPAVTEAAVALWHHSLLGRRYRAWQRWAEPVGTAEVARRLGVARQTVDNWRQRPANGFPDPDLPLVGGPAWHWSTIRRWAAATDHLPADDLG